MLLLRKTLFFFFAFASDASVTIFNRRHKAITSSAADFCLKFREISPGEERKKKFFFSMSQKQTIERFSRALRWLFRTDPDPTGKILASSPLYPFSFRRIRNAKETIWAENYTNSIPPYIRSFVSIEFAKISIDACVENLSLFCSIHPNIIAYRHRRVSRRDQTFNTFKTRFSNLFLWFTMCSFRWGKNKKKKMSRSFFFWERG